MSHEHERATKILSGYLSEAKKWAAVGTVGEARQRRRERSGEGFKFRYIYVHQNAPHRGFHTHILCTVPRRATKQFEAWSMKALARLARHPGDRRSVRVVPSYARTEDAAVTRGWRWFGYIAKQLDQNAVWGRKDEPGRSLRTIFRVWPHETALPVTSAQLVGGSHDIWTGAQNEAQFESLLERYEYDQLFSGLEMAEWRRWCSSEEMRKVLENLYI